MQRDSYLDVLNTAICKFKAFKSGQLEMAMQGQGQGKGRSNLAQYELDNGGG